MWTTVWDAFPNPAAGVTVAQITLRVPSTSWRPADVHAEGKGAQMRYGSMRRTLAAASAATMAGAALVVAGSGVAAAAPVTATASDKGMTGIRTVSNSTPVYGETVTVTTELRRSGSNAWLAYWVKDHHPDCFEYVENSLEWTVGGKTYNEGNAGDDVTVGADFLEINPWAANSWIPPVVATADYVVNCDAGAISSGGMSWDSTWFSLIPPAGGEVNKSALGPTINVQRKGTSVFLHAPTSPQAGQTVTLSVDTTNIPDGSQITFTVDGQPVGTGTVSGNSATLPWTPTTAGTKTVRASFAQTATHGGSQSGERIVTVSPTNVNSNVTVDVAGTPKVGQSSQVTATVTPEGAGGTVVFKDNGTVIGDAIVDASGNASIGWIPTVAGQRTIDAEFSGRPGVNPSSNGVPVTVAEADPNQVATTTVLDPIATSPAGEPITLTATVSTNAPGGTVTFYDGSTVIGTAPVGAGGVATFEWTPTTDGVRTVRAEFSGEGVNLASAGTAQAIITPAVEDPEDPTDPGTPGGNSGSAGSLTGSLGGENASGSLGSLGS